ncbi:Ferric/cupric reductase transmembrane component 7 [Penicillium rolfsii]|nr:Ferric/cupric reductase transmembrane component 7 [Penicillium rolfsii]
MFISKHVVLPHLFPRWYLWGPVTRLQALLYCVHIAGTLTCNIFGVSNLSVARSRAGSLAVFHLVPLALAPRLGMGAKLFGLSLGAYRNLHSSIGFMATFQSILHVILAVRMISFDLNNRHQRNGLIATIALSSLTLMILPAIRRRLYELFLKSHFALGTLGIVMVWMHLNDRLNLNGKLLIASLGAYLVSFSYNLAQQIYRNTMAGKFFTVADITRTKDAVELTFRPRRPWKVYAGQYVYLKAPGVRLLSFAESHPFNIIWWENGPDGKGEVISILAKVQSGFTKDLFSCPCNHLRVIIDGPYGEKKETEPYDGVVMICTGIGIAAQLPYAREMILRQKPNDHDHPHRKQRVSIIWMMEKECKLL